MMSSFFQAVWSFFFPARCTGCGISGVALCSKCIQRLPPAVAIENERFFAAFDYSSSLVERIIKDCKYYRKSEGLYALSKAAAPLIAEFIAEHLQSEQPESIRFVPIPQHRTKAQSRGFNQSARIARVLAAFFEGTSVEQMLIKTRDTLPQVRMNNKLARRENVSNSMEVPSTVDPAFLYVVVDDVTTTGATLSEGVRALRDAGAKKVLAVALAHGDQKRK